MIKAISFDVDGTLMDRKFMDSVWLEWIPFLYAIKRGISFEEAKKLIIREYDEVGDRRIEWYDLDYWISRFGLNVSKLDVFEACEHEVKPYPEVPRVLKSLKDEGFRLVIITNSPKEFADFQLKRSRLDGYFEKVFSSFSDFGLIKKTKSVYAKVLRSLKVSPPEFVHVGDHMEFDFEVPKKLGIKAFLLDRSGRDREEFTIGDLTELEDMLKR